ncbi:hypothetical protein MTO96_037093, partial [Rhipicephalus appendiculatus]
MGQVLQFAPEHTEHCKTYSILRNIVDPDKTKYATSRTLQKIAEYYSGLDDDLIKAPKERYI